MTIRLPLPARRVFDDARPLLLMPRFGLTVRPDDCEPHVIIAEFARPRRVTKDILTVRCIVDGVTFELMKDDSTNKLHTVVCHMEKRLDDAQSAMRVLPLIAIAMLAFDHRARSGVPEAIGMVGLIDWLAPAASMRNAGRMSGTVRDADLAMADAFGAAMKWMEDGHG